MRQYEAISSSRFLRFGSISRSFSGCARRGSPRIAVDEVFFALSKVMKIVERIGQEYFAQIPKRARQICSLFPEALPMG
jgi:hypothetical protein